MVETPAGMSRNDENGRRRGHVPAFCGRKTRADEACRHPTMAELTDCLSKFFGHKSGLVIAAAHQSISLGKQNFPRSASGGGTARNSIQGPGVACEQRIMPLKTGFGLFGTAGLTGSQRYPNRLHWHDSCLRFHREHWHQRRAGWGAISPPRWSQNVAITDSCWGYSSL